MFWNTGSTGKIFLIQKFTFEMLISTQESESVEVFREGKYLYISTYIQTVKGIDNFHPS